MARHVTRRELAMMDGLTRQETLALVGWMALANAFGEVSEGGLSDGERIPKRAQYQLGVLMRKIGRPTIRFKTASQQTPSNFKRQVRARTSQFGLTT